MPFKKETMKTLRVRLTKIKLFVFKASPSSLVQCDRSPCSPFQSVPLHSSPLQTPTTSSPGTSPCSATASPIGRLPSYHNGHHRPPPAPHKSPYHSKMFLFCEAAEITVHLDYNLCLPPLQARLKDPLNLRNTQRVQLAPSGLWVTSSSTFKIRQQEYCR